VREFITSIAIQAEPETVWSVLTDASGWPLWNPAIERIEGTIAESETITIYTAADPDHALSVKVSDVVPMRRMVWRGGMRWGVYTGVRTYTIAPRNDGGVDFTMRVVYRGLLAPFFDRSIPDMQPAFDELAAALKQRCESMA